MPSSPGENPSAGRGVYGCPGLNRHKGKLYGLLLIVLLVAIGWLYVRVVDTEVLGFTHDDGVYAVAGKSLAQGEGFKLLHLVGQPGQIKYPFVYPAILALVWLVNPSFPANLPALNYITIGFTLAACALCHLYFRKIQNFPGWLSLLIIALCTANFYFIYFFSSVMSEAPYLFFSMLTLWFAHRFSTKESTLSLRSVLILIALSSITFLARVPGVALMAAIGVWLLLNRQWKNSLIYGIGCALTGLLPWVLWVKLNTPVINDMNYPLVNAYSNYGLELVHNVAAGTFFSDLRISFFSLINQMLQDMVALLPNFVRIYPQIKHYPDLMVGMSLTTLASAYLLFGYYLLQCISALRKGIIGGKLNARAFSFPGLYLFFYILLITLWNYEDQMARFLTPLLPLLWMYFFKPFVQWLPDLGLPRPPQKKRVIAAVLGALTISTLGLWAFPHTSRTVYMSRSQHWIDSGKYRWMWDEYKTVFAWIRQNLPPHASLGAASDVVFYLYTDRPTFYVFYASLRRANGKFLPQSIPLLMKSLDHYKVQYLVAEPHLQARIVRFPVNLVAKDLLTQFPERFEKVYTSPKGALMIYKILPPTK